MPTEPISAVVINGFVIDVAINEDHKFESEVTDYPVESGGTISDNIRDKPIVVTLEGIVSNTPIGVLAIMRDDNVKPVDQAYRKMLQIRANREPVTISTSLDTFEHMALKELSIPRSSGGGDALRFTAQFQQIQVVTNKQGIRVAIPAAVGGHGSTASPDVARVPDMVMVTINNNAPFWYDQRIDGWREGVVLHVSQDKELIPNGSLVPDVRVTDVPHWDLFRNKPLDVPYSTWVSFKKKDEATQLEPTVQSAENAARDYIAKIPKNKRYAPGNGIPTIQVKVLTPDQYTLR